MYHLKTSKMHYSSGFTIVELLIVVVVIAILAAITIVSYNGVLSRATETALKSDLHNGATQLALKQSENGVYPSPGLPSDVKASQGNTFRYDSNGTTFCLTATSSKSNIPAYRISESGSITQGECPYIMQKI